VVLAEKGAVKRFGLALSIGCLLLACLPAAVMGVVVADLDQSNDQHALAVGRRPTLRRPSPPAGPGRSQTSSCT